MMKMACKEYTDRIIDYVDGELPKDEARMVAQHLAVCEGCRRAAQALERSLGLAKVIWSDNLGDSESPAQAEPARRSRRIGFYAIAASIVIAASTLTLTLSNRDPQHPSTRFEDVEPQVDRAGMAAQLLAATRVIAQIEGMESVVASQYEFILQEYAGTPAAESVRAVHGSSLGGIR